MRTTLALAGILICNIINNDYKAQLKEYNKQRLTIDKSLMIGLGTWSSINLLGSAIGWAVSKEESTKYFHQMNVMWNTVNLGLSIPGYIKAHKGKNELSLFETMKEQRKTETIFLINAGIDLAYISSGILLKNKSSTDLSKENQLKGFGNSIILQGGFLLLFDWIAYSMHSRHFKNKLSPLLQRIHPSDNGIGFKFHLDQMGNSKLTTMASSDNLN